MLKRQPTIDETRAAFTWDIPEYYNIGVDVCDRIAAKTPNKIAIIDVAKDGSHVDYTFENLRHLSNQIANVLSGHAQKQDRIAVLLPQSVETAASHIAITKIGCISLPLFKLFGPDALRHRLKDSGTRIVITDKAGAKILANLKYDLPDLIQTYTIDGPSDDGICLKTACQSATTTFKPSQTKADDPAFLIYTSGTTGPPKGALHAHRVLIGHLPGVEMSHDFLPQPGDKIWTPADWAWIGGLFDVLMPALHHGIPVVAHRFEKFDASAAFDLIETHHIRNAFLPPTALKIMRRDAPQRSVKLRSVASGGETLGKELLAWGQHAFGTTVNEFYGQTECNMIVSSCAALTPAEPGVMGFAVPGHDVRIVDAEQAIFSKHGDIAVKAPDPVMFLRYWNNPQATEKKFIQIEDKKWLLTGDKGYETASGRLCFVGRDDDIINSAGYRIGPSEVEDCLLTHPAVQMAGVVGQPDDIKGTIIVAYIQLANGHTASDDLADTIKQHVKEQLAAHEFPRIVRFIDRMPLTTTGKIIRAELRSMAQAE